MSPIDVLKEELHFCLLSPKDIEPVLLALKKQYSLFDVTFIPSRSGVNVTLFSKDRETLFSACERLRSHFSTYQFFSVQGKIEEALYNLFIQKNKTLAFAESCTGGNLAALITSIAGASQYFLGSLVTYSNALKMKILGVEKSTLDVKGDVSKETAEEMLKGVFNVTQADYAIAVTGTAGPSGGTVEKPVGTVWGAIGERDKNPLVWNLKLQGDREHIIHLSSYKLLSVLYRYVAYDIRN